MVVPVFSLATNNPSEEELMVMRVSLVRPDFEVNLFKQCRVFDYHKAWIKDSMLNPVLNDFNTKQQAIDASMQMLRSVIITSMKQMEPNFQGQLP